MEPSGPTTDERTGEAVVLVDLRYALLNCLGVGGMGEVWRAHDRVTQTTVAVKVLRPVIAGEPAAELRFQREVEAMARLNHPRVVPIIDAGVDPRVGLFFVMALQHGRPLHEVTQGWTHWRQVWPVVDQILETLAFAHANGVIHRDIKPDNILIDDEGEAVLLDFGVARLRDRARSGTSAYDMLGTVDYAAPEQATGSRRRIGPWTDLYCFGIVLWELLCGRLPFLAASAVQSLMLRLDNGCPRLDPRPGFTTPRGLWQTLDRMMRPHAFDRFRNAAEARQAFEALLDEPFEVINPAAARTAVLLATTPQSTLTDSEAERLLQRRQARYQQSEASLSRAPLESPIRPPSLVGRDEVLLQLSRGLERWRRNPQPGVLVITGPPGCGKTRLARELVVPFLATGEVDGHLHRWQGPTTLNEIALSIAGALGLDQDATISHLDWWLEGHGLFDDAQRRSLIDWCITPPKASDTLERHLERFAAFIQCCATSVRPFVLTLDGLERISGGALAVARALRAHRVPAITLITTRSLDPPPGVEAPTWLAPATRALEPLSDDAIEAMLGELTALRSGERAQIVAAVKGNPQRLMDVLGILRRRGDLLPAWPRWVRPPADWLKEMDSEPGSDPQP